MLEVAAPAVKQLRAIADDVRCFKRAELSVATGAEAALVVGPMVVLGHVWKGAGAACALGIGALMVALTRVAGSVTGVMAIVGLVAFGHVGQALPGAGEAGLLVAIGGGVQTLAACLHRLPAPGKIQVAELYEALRGCAQRPPTAG